MSKRILITPRSLTQRHSPDLQALENAGYELVYARPGITPTEEELLDLVPIVSDGSPGSSRSRSECYERRPTSR